MTTLEKLNEIIDNSVLDLSIVETTTSRTGYPENTSWAIVGFEDYEEAEHFAETNNLQLMFLNKRDGWNLWHREGYYTGEPITITPELFGDNAEVFETVEEFDEDRRETLRALIDDEAPVKSIRDIVNKWYAIREELEGAGEDSVAVIIGGVLEGICPKHPTHFSWDSKTETLAAVLK